jgi:uracil-DNA glycosylase
VIQFGPTSKILIVGQAPGRRVHETGIPWNDASGNKLRDWLGVPKDSFYNPENFSIIPMGFCYPGKGKSGDLPPLPACAKLWHSRLFDAFESSPMILLIGQYAQRHYLNSSYKGNLTDTVKSYREYLPRYFALPHPSPRNQNWLKVNPWFGAEVLPDLKSRVADLLQ